MLAYYKKKGAKIFGTIIFFLLFFLGPAMVHAAALSISPSSGNFEVGNRLTVRVVVTSDAPFNAVSGTLSFPSSVFSVESVSKAGSVLNFWVTEPTVSKSSGTVKFEGVALGGFLGSSGTVVTVNLRAVSPGTGKFSFQSGQILANDGEGTDITGNLIGATFTVAEAAPKPAPEPKPIKVVPEVTPEPTPEPAPEVVQPAPTLRAPEIQEGSKYGAKSILGTSNYPRAQVLITFTATDGTKVFIIGGADVDGSFNILVPNSLKRGMYSVTAVMIQEDKTNSAVSLPIEMKVGSFLSDIGYWVWVLIALLILTILYLVMRTHIHFTRGSSSVNSSALNELRKAEGIIHKSFDILREDVTLYDKDEHTMAEHRRVAGIKRDINDAEKIISKKIKDIETE